MVYDVFGSIKEKTNTLAFIIKKITMNINCNLFLFNYLKRSFPWKNAANKPGPVWEPIIVPI